MGGFFVFRFVFTFYCALGVQSTNNTTALPYVLVRAESMPKAAPNTDTLGKSLIDELVQRGARLAVQRGLFALARGNILLAIAVRAS